MEEVKERIVKVGIEGSEILGCGIAILLSYALTGHGIPCLFRALTGYLCPGCGMTRATLSILTGHLAKAWSLNALSLTLVPVFLLYLGYRIIRYVLTGQESFRTWENVFLVLSLIIAILYAIVRNL